MENHLKWYRTWTHFLGTKQANPLFNFCVGVWVGGHPRANVPFRSKDAQENSTFSDIIVVTEGDRGKMVSYEKLTKNWWLRGLKLRGFTWNQRSTPSFIYENDQRTIYHCKSSKIWFWKEILTETFAVLLSGIGSTSPLTVERKFWHLATY